MDARKSNNNVTVKGKVITAFEYSHVTYDERFFKIIIRVKRLSGNTDDIPVLVSEKLIDTTVDPIGKYVTVHGEYRSYNAHDDSATKLVLSVFAREIEYTEEEPDEETNYVFLDGYICRKPSYRETPLGREIADLLLAVNRPYGKSDYIPCIVWGRNAKYISRSNIGERIQITGRIQSREYEKRLSDTESVTRTAYEVSVRTLMSIK